MDRATTNGDRRRDVAPALLLLAGTAAYAFFAVDLRQHPEEDAAMLLRYAGHVARGYGVVWNVGEAPLDGATDFLFMLLVAALHWLGLTLEAAAHAVGLAAHAGLVLLAYFAARRLFHARREWAMVPAVSVAAGPGLRYAAAAYGTPLFALLSAAAFAVAAAPAPPAGWRRVEGRRAWSFGFLALLLGLARPEGVFLGAFVLVGVAAARDGRDLLPWRRAYLGVHLTLGLAYFAWRWLYFGHPLPNPYYKKGSFLLHWHSLHMAARDLWTLAWPFLLACALALLLREGARWGRLALVPAGLFTALWVLVSDETNYFMRFRYPLLPILALGSVPAARAIASAVGRARPDLARLSRLSWPAALAAVAAVGLPAHLAGRSVAPRRMGLYDAAIVLRRYAIDDYTLVTTEAGLLPLYSQWNAVDAWGLNDRHVAETGSIDAAYLDRYHPEVIVMHAYFSPGVRPDDRRVIERALGPRWYAMVRTLQAYAEANDYVLAACFGRNAWDTHYYYVRRGFPRSGEIVAGLRGLDYYWDGEPTVDFAGDATPQPTGERTASAPRR